MADWRKLAEKNLKEKKVCAARKIMDVEAFFFRNTPDEILVNHEFFSEDYGRQCENILNECRKLKKSLVGLWRKLVGVFENIWGNDNNASIIRRRLQASFWYNFSLIYLRDFKPRNIELEKRWSKPKTALASEDGRWKTAVVRWMRRRRWRRLGQKQEEEMITAEGRAKNWSITGRNGGPDVMSTVPLRDEDGAAPTGRHLPALTHYAVARALHSHLDQ